MTVKTALSLAAIAIVSGCGSLPPTMPAGYVPEGVRQVESPLTAIEQRLQRAGPLILAMASEGDTGREAAGHVLTLTREIAAMMGDPMFDPWPLTRAHIRTRVLFLMDDDPEMRGRALDECRERFARIRAGIARKRGLP